MNGELAILNVSDGDTKLTFNPRDEAETERAKAVVVDMLRRGYVVLVEVGRDEKGPTYRRVDAFDPETSEYIVAGTPPEESSHAQPSSPPPRRTRGRKASATVERFDARKSKAVAVAPISGG